jgi:hypothetical protein
MVIDTMLWNVTEAETNRPPVHYYCLCKLTTQTKALVMTAPAFSQVIYLLPVRTN